MHCLLSQTLNWCRMACMCPMSYAGTGSSRTHNTLGTVDDCASVLPVALQRSAHPSPSLSNCSNGPSLAPSPSESHLRMRARVSSPHRSHTNRALRAAVTTPPTKTPSSFHLWLQSTRIIMTNMMMHSITPMMISSFDRACFGVLSSSYSLIDEHQSGLAPAFCTHNKLGQRPTS